MAAAEMQEDGPQELKKRYRAEDPLGEQNNYEQIKDWSL